MRRSTRNRLLYALVFLTGCAFNIAFSNRYPFWKYLTFWHEDTFPFTTISGIIGAGLWAAWGVSVQYRILDRTTRGLLQGISGSMLFYSFVQFVRYNFFKAAAMAPYRHFTNYLYQIPVTLIPLLLFLAVCKVVSPERSVRRLGMALGAINTALVLVILTNDLHYWAVRPHPVFGFNFNFENSGWPMYAVYVWSYGLLLLSLITLLYRVRLPSARRKLWIPLACLIVGAGIMVVQVLSPETLMEVAARRTDVHNLMIITFIEGCIAIGLIPSNEGYREVFQASGISARITDSAGHTVLESHLVRPLPEAALRAAADGPVDLDGNTRLQRKAIRGGHVYWTNDFTEVNQVHVRLEETLAQLIEARAALQAANELREEHEANETKRQIYQEIARATAPQLQQLARLSREARERPEQAENAMRRAMLYLAYIKRRANLALLAEQNPSLPVAELTLSISESIRYLHYSDVPGMVAGETQAAIPSALALILFDLFENAVERALPGLSGVIVLVSGTEKGADLEFQLGTPAAAPEKKFWQERLDPFGVCLKETEADGTLRLYLPLPRGGEEAQA